MSKRLQDIFEECLERLQQGDSIENCLMSYPEVAAELEMLLRTARNVNWRASIVQPRPEFKARARAQFIGAQHYAAQVQEPKRQPTFFSLQRAWVPALAMVLILVFSSLGTAVASNAMPDEPLYPVKLATEQVQLTFSFSDEDKAELYAKLVETRSQEIVAMATQGKPEQVIIASQRLDQHLEAAEVAINKVEETKVKPAPAATQTTPIVPTPAPVPSTGDTVAKAEKLRQSLTTTISKNLTDLQDAQSKVPDKAKEALQKAIELSKKRQTKLKQPPAIKPTPAPTPGPVPPVHPKPPQEPKIPPDPPNPPGGQQPPKPPTIVPGGNGKNTPLPSTPSDDNSPTSGPAGSGKNTGDASKTPSSFIPASSPATTSTSAARPATNMTLSGIKK